MIMISAGSRGPFVRLMQSLLNRAGASPQLQVDGDWGPRTDSAFQRVVGASSVNGLQTNDAIWRNLGLTTIVDHPVHLFGQPTNMTCWSASMTMLRGTNLSAGSGTARLGASGGLLPDDANVAAFARAHGKQVVSSHQSLPVPSLISILRRGPAIICGWGRDVRRPDGSLAPSFGHASVLSGIWSTNDPDGLTTMFRVHDPWPPNHGAIWFDFYHDRPGRPVGYARFGDVFIQ
jgi:hypothetical protein